MSQKTNNSKNDIYAMVEIKYLEITKKQFGKEVELEQLEPYTKEFLNMLYNNVNSVRFKYELLMFPKWAWGKSNLKIYKVGDSLYSHIKLKQSIIG